jgi:hypothetical protein
MKLNLRHTACQGKTSQALTEPDDLILMRLIHDRLTPSSLEYLQKAENAVTLLTCGEPVARKLEKSSIVIISADWIDTPF